MAFNYPISECDVRECDRPRLEKFRERFSVWQEWLSNDEHSIWRQIHGMLWNDMVFRTINECRRIAHKCPSPNVDFNRAVASFIDEGYVAKQLLAIRRLTETNGRGDAINIPRLLDDMKANADLFTREMYVCHDGLPFDPEPARQRSLRTLAAEAKKTNGVTVTSLPTNGPEAYDTATLVHQHFDCLIGNENGQWLRNDKLDPAIFDKIKSKLGICAGINKVASKFIAHAADAGSRGQLDEQERAVTLNRIEAGQRKICRVVAYINGPLLYISDSGFLPTPQYDHLKHLEKRWLDPKNTEIIDDFWNSRAEKVESWTNGNWNQLLNLPG
ncbi:MAG: hypothetical protein GY791_16500 [Alphaproteobacteria bacterium]|nr:hypothetical protein [Alphaproteobacteria bacterium]